MADSSFARSISAVELEPWPLEPGQVGGGDPQVRGAIPDEDEHVQRGIWEHTAGTSRDVEADEMFVVVGGRATVAVQDGPTFEVGPGDVGVLRAGDRTTWTVHETLRKVFQVTKH